MLDPQQIDHIRFNKYLIEPVRNLNPKLFELPRHQCSRAHQSDACTEFG